MKTKLMGLLLVAVVGCMAVATMQVSANGIRIDEQPIQVQTKDDGYAVTEEIVFNNTRSNPYAGELRMWIPADGINLNVYPQQSTKKTSTYAQPGQIISYNLSAHNLSIDANSSATFIVKYTLPKNTAEVSVKALYDTQRLTIHVDNEMLFQSVNISKNNTASITLPVTKEEGPTLIYLVYVVIIAAIGGALILVSRYVKSAQEKKREEAETEEFLEAKKKLLLNFLKELEKEHRSEKISDHTYNKLKKEFKQKAINVTRKLNER